MFMGKLPQCFGQPFLICLSILTFSHYWNICQELKTPHITVTLVKTSLTSVSSKDLNPFDYTGDSPSHLSNFWSFALRYNGHIKSFRKSLTHCFVSKQISFAIYPFHFSLLLLLLRFHPSLFLSF